MYTFLLSVCTCVCSLLVGFFEKKQSFVGDEHFLWIAESDDLTSSPRRKNGSRAVETAVFHLDLNTRIITELIVNYAFS